MSVIYVVDDTWHNSVSVVDKLDDWTIVAGGYVSDVDENRKVTVPVSLKYTGTAELGTEEITFTIGGKDYKATANAVTGLYTFDVETSNVGWNNVKLDLTAANFVVNVKNSTGNDDFSVSVNPKKVGILSTNNIVVTITSNLQDGFKHEQYKVNATVEGQSLGEMTLDVVDGVMSFTVEQAVAYGVIDIEITSLSPVKD